MKNRILKLLKENDSELFADYESEILPILEDVISEEFVDVADEFEFEQTDEELEHKSRDGFISWIDGGFRSGGFTYINYLVGTGKGFKSSSANEEVQRMADYNYTLAKETFMEHNPELVVKYGEDKINYDDLYELGLGTEAEELSEYEHENMDDSVHCFIQCFYKKNDDNGEQFTVQAVVNLESPYHRAGKNEHYSQKVFSVTRLEDLENELRKNVQAAKSEIFG